MPLQKRLPKYGFTSRVAAVTSELRLSELELVGTDIIDLSALKKAGLVNKNIRRAKVFASGSINRAVTLRGIGVTKGALSAILAANGSVEE